MDGAQKGPSLVKQLASCNQTLRERALRVLIKTWLPAQSQLPDDDMKKLWKGLFYCVWHADKVPYQSRLIDRLSSLLLSLDLPLALHYLSVFFLTMRREWAGIDALRMDKYYLLIRRFFNSFFALMKKQSWDLELVRRLVGVLEERALFADDKFQANGFNYHIASVYLEELRPFLLVKAEVLEVLLKPFIDVMGKSSDKVLLAKIKSNVFDVLLKMGKDLLDSKKSGSEESLSDDTVVYGTIALNVGFASKFYELGSSPECLQGNRKTLLGLHEEFSKLEKELTSSGIEVPIPNVCVNTDDDEVPNLIPIVDSESKMDSDGVLGHSANGSAKKILKKQKKAKTPPGGGVEAAEKVNKRKSKKNKKNVKLMDQENTDLGNSNFENMSNEQIGEGKLFLNESMLSNLQMQFEKVAAEEALQEENARDAQNAAVNGIGSRKKRKRVKSVDGLQPLLTDYAGGVGSDNEGESSERTAEKSAKKVRFSMKNNLVWKPHTPLPPQDLRLPPSLTPRGSALKKGLSPGPIREMPPLMKKAKQRARTVKKVRKTVKSISPAVKRLKKLKSLSP